MVVLDMNDETVSTEHISLREERKRTGRYVAAGTAIFLSLLGVYQALIQGTPEYAALFAPAVIMFVYVLWILHASRNQNARLLLRNQRAAAAEAAKEATPEIVVEILPEKIDNEKQPCCGGEERNIGIVVEKDETPDNGNGKQFNRSYSIA